MLEVTTSLLVHSDDADSQQDMFSKSDEEDNAEEDESEAESKWRTLRHERETFIKEQVCAEYIYGIWFLRIFVKW